MHLLRISFLACVLLAQIPAFAMDSDGVVNTADDWLRFCRFGPKMQTFEPVIADSSGKNKCAGTMKIHGVMWACSTKEQATGKNAQYLTQLRKSGQAMCEKLCKSRSKSCSGVFEAPQKCGRETDDEDAYVVGQEACRPDCSGKYFSYCALYDTGFKTKNPNLVAKQKPNCRCVSVADPK